MARHGGDMVDRVEEVGMAGDVGGPAVLAVALRDGGVARGDHGAVDVAAPCDQRRHQMAAARLADEVERGPPEMRLELGQRGIDQRHLARPAPVAVMAGRAQDAGPREMQVGSAEQCRELLAQRLDVARRGRAIEVVGDQPVVAQLDRVAAQEDHRIGARTLWHGAIKGEHVVLAVDLDSHAARPVAVRRIGDDAVHGLVARERLVAQPGKDGKRDHSIRMSML
jgi:hypothetical protein